MTLYQCLTLAVGVGRRLRRAQNPLKLLLEVVGPLQQGLEPVDELCTDHLLNTTELDKIKVL